MRLSRSLPALAPILTAAALGAQAGAHWAYHAPQRPTPPAVADGGWVRNPIDAFVLARLEAAGHRPAPQEARARLLRRVYLDLTGLPPDVAAVDAFLADKRPDTYERVVDRLLASPRFGEHHARQWLDLARYADSNGFQADQLRDSWAWRDWVIDALNADMPFDRFTILQLAGDLLPEPTLADRIATGFHRTVTCNVEAGVHPEANRVDQVVDRVNTTATVWLGATLACAQCHDHKYDPFTQRDYYRLFAFFNNTPLEVKNPNGDTGVRFDFYGPKVELPLLPDQAARRAALQEQLEEARAGLAAVERDAAADQRDWERAMLAGLRDGAAWQVLPVKAFASSGDEDHEVLPDGSVLVGGRVPGTATYTVTVDTQLRGIQAFRLETLTHPSLPGTGPGRGDDARPNFILSELQVHALPLSQGNGAAEPIALHGAAADYSQRGWPVAAAIDGRQDKGWAIGGGFFKDHWASFRTRRPVGADGGTRLTFTLDQNYGRGRTIGRLRLSASTADPDALALPKQIAAILRLPDADRRPAQRKRLRTFYLKNHARTAQLDRRVKELQQQLAAVQPPTTLVMVEDAARETRVMQRGDYLRPGAAVTAGTPEALHPFRPEWPRNRLGLARWLVSDDNPLVARVTVNRWWSAMFGRGLVATEEDFGLRAAAPSHPRLLDWLATELVRAGWSRKHVLRLIVTSATYRQASRRRADLADPDNRLCGRGPRFRMTAEMIRDNALAVGGLLCLEQGGPPVYPPQPDGLWRQTGRNEPKYVTATGADRFRRGIYVIWRRAAPYPSFVLFDGPDRASCHPMRSRTNTPMQALTLMNDPAYVEAALGLARRVLQERPGATVEVRVEHAFRTALARRPTATEAQHLAALQRREAARLRAAPQRAAALVEGVPQVEVAEVDRVELAAWFFVAQVLLNLDETVSKG